MSKLTNRRWTWGWLVAVMALVMLVAAPAGATTDGGAGLLEAPSEDEAGEWEVRRGDHLWSIAAETLAVVHDEPAALGEIADYWRLVIAANVDLTDPNLIYPGQTVVLPPLEARTATVEVFFLRGEQLEAVERTVTVPAVGAGAITALLAGPEEPGLFTEVPEGTELLGLDIADGIATVDLSGEFETGGGTLSARARVAQVVFTLTQFDTVDGVLFHIDGERVDVITSEGLVVEEPVDRSGFADLAP
jgi:hypothetical protein